MERTCQFLQNSHRLVDQTLLYLDQEESVTSANPSFKLFLMTLDVGESLSSDINVDLMCISICYIKCFS